MKVDVLDARPPGGAQATLDQQLIAPWAIDEYEPLTYGARPLPALAGSGSDDRGADLTSRRSAASGSSSPVAGRSRSYHDRLKVDETVSGSSSAS